MQNKQMTTSTCNSQWRVIVAGRILALIGIISVLLGATASLQAQPTTNLWVGSNTVWGTSSAWSPANVPNWVDSMAIFSNSTNSINNPSSVVNYTIGTLSDTGGSTIGLSGQNLVLNFQASSGTPIINVTNGSGVYWYWQQIGTQGFTKLGTGLLTGRYEGTPNNFSGPVIIGQGTLGLQVGGNLANASSLTISNTATVSMQNSGNASATGIAAVTQPFPVYLAGGGTATLGVSYAGQTLILPGNVQSTSGTALKFTGPGMCVLAGTNSLAGTLTVASGNLVISSATTNYGSVSVSANATNGVLATVPSSSMTVANLTLVGTNNSVLEFSGGWAGTPTVPMLNITNLLTFVTNVPAPILLTGGGWVPNSAIPLLHFGTLVNTNPLGVFASFALAPVPEGITAALVDDTVNNQINLSISSIKPLVWSPSTANANWTAAGDWTLQGGASGQTYTETMQFGPAVQFDDSLSPAGPSIIVTNNSYLSPNSVVFNNSTHNYTLLGSGGLWNNASITLSGNGYVTNSQANYYFGNTMLNAGTLVLNNILALGPIGTNGGANAAYGTISFQGGTLQFTANNINDYSSRFSTAANQAYSLNTAGKSIGLSTPLTSSGGSLTVAGNGLLTLKAASTYTGPTTNGGTFKLGVANALPITTALSLGGNDGSQGTLDLAGFNQQVSGLTLNPAASAATITNSSKLTPVTLTYNGGASTFGGNIVDGTANGANGGQSISLAVMGGSLTLTGQNSYTNTTTIANGGQLYVQGSITSTNVAVGSGSLFDVSAISYKTAAGGTLSGIGNVNGSVEIAGLAAIQPDALGAVANHGTLTFSNNLTLDQYALVNLNVATTPTSASNDRIAVLGQVSANDPNGNTVQIAAESGTAALSTTGDYILISSVNGISGSASPVFNPVPVWVGARPSNYAHYTVVVSGNNVVLRYSAGVQLSGSGTVSPASGVHQNYLFNVLVTPGTGSTGIGVAVDFTSLGGSFTSLTGNATNLFSTTYAVPGTVVVGVYPVPFTVTDAQGDTFNGTINLSLGNGTLTWTGGGANANWDSFNWANKAVPDLTSGVDPGDALVFAGPSSLPVMDNAYYATSVTFSNNAGSFDIASSGGNSLTLDATITNVLENDSANTQTLNVPINLNSPLLVNAAGGPLIIGNQVENSGNQITVEGTGSTSFTDDVDGGGNLVLAGPGTLTLTGASTYTYNNTILGGGTMLLSGLDNLLPTGGTVEYIAPATLNLGGSNETIANLNLSGLSAGTATATNGNLTVTTTSLNFSPNTAATAATTVDLSGLNSLTYSLGTIYFYGAIGANSTLKLAQTNNLTATAIYLANGGLTAVAANDTATILLGQTNAINTGTFQMGGYHNAAGAIAFNTGLINPSLTLRGLNGTGYSVANMSIGVNNNGTPPPCSFDTSAGFIDAMINNIILMNNNSGGGVDTLSLSNGTLNVGAFHLNDANGTTTSASSAIVNQNAGTVLVGTLDLNDNSSTGVPTTTSTYNLGNGTNGSGLLSAYIITFNATVAPGTNSRATLNFANGTIENYEPDLGQSDSLGGVVVGGSATTENLDISGFTGGGGPNNSLTLNIVLANTGVHNFYAETNYTITEEATALISGSGGLTANGPGLVTLLGTNTYTGATTVGAGTLEVAQPALAAHSTVTVNNGAVLQLDFAVTNTVAALVVNGVSKPAGVYNSSTTPGYLTGPGSLQVVPISTNAYLTSLALNPADGLMPGFATNTFVYSATNASGVTPTVTVVNGNLNATNELYLNGVVLQALASGVPSLALTNFGVGATNVLKVLVTAQDGVTTNLYTVDVTELPGFTVSTNSFAFTNVISGNNLNLSWPTNNLGWRLEVQTNSAGTGLGTNWFTWPNSTNVTSLSIPINPANSSVFLRMVYP